MSDINHPRKTKTQPMTPEQKAVVEEAAKTSLQNTLNI